MNPAFEAPYSEQRVIPATLYIETVANACTARCPMCSINEWTRPTKVMSLELFQAIIKAFEGGLEHIRRINLSGCGEPLLDKKIHEKIKLIKEQYPHIVVGFPSNCSEMTEERATQIVASGLDYIICSVDGARKETHERSRPGLDFDRVRENVENLIRERNRAGRKMSIYIRTILQGFNDSEWPDVQAFWKSRLDPSRGDDVGSFPMHAWPGSENLRRSASVGEGEPVYCSYLNESMVIYADGRVGLCCVDDNGQFDIGNVLECDPISLFNTADAFVTARRMMAEGQVGAHSFCGNCDAFVAVRKRSY